MSNAQQDAGSTPRISRRAAYLSATAYAVLFGLFLAIAHFLDPRLFYDQYWPVFLTTLGFLKGFLGRPGGLAEYASIFLSQYLSIPWLGAAILALLASGVCLAAFGLLKAARGRPVPPALACIPAVLLLMLQAQYQHHYVTAPALLIALAFANLYVWTAPRAAWGGPVVLLALTAVVYYVAGGMVVLFAVLCGVFEMLKLRRIVLGLSCIAWGSALPFLFSMYSYRVGLWEAYSPLETWHREFEYVFFPATALATCTRVALWVFFPAALAWSVLRPKRTPRAGGWTLASLAAFLVVAGALVWFSFDRDSKNRLRVDCCSQTRQWEPLLETARRLPPRLYDVYVVHDVNLALYHTGRLLQEMFRYPQSLAMPSLQLTTEQSTNLGYLKFAQLTLDMGQVNFAQHWAHCALEYGGNNPECLKVIIRAYVLQGYPQAARTFLNALSADPLSRRWAEDFRRSLDADPEMRARPEIAEIRPLMVKEDAGYGGIGGFAYDTMLKMPLRANGRNRMAFEYLVSAYLLYGRLDDAVGCLGQLDNFDYAGIPRHLEEAVLVYNSLHPGQEADLHGRRIADEARRRQQEFEQDYIRFLKSAPAARLAEAGRLAERWGDSYFFYAVFGFSEPRPGWALLRPASKTEEKK